jgi:hypothetical protein
VQADCKYDKATQTAMQEPFGEEGAEEFLDRDQENCHYDEDEGFPLNAF